MSNAMGFTLRAIGKIFVHFVISPADVETHAIGRHIRQGMVQRFHLQLPRSARTARR